MKFIITGTSGYIGSQLSTHLRNGGHLVFEINRNLNLQYKDIYSIYSLSEIITKEDPDVIIHLASLFRVEHSPNDINKLIEANITIGTNLLEAMRLSNCKKIITTGSSWEYYNSNEYLPVNLYSATKHAFHNISKYYVEAHDINLINLVLYDTYGPLDKRNKLIPMLVKSVYENLPLNLSIGTQKLYLTHIKDICLAFESAALILMHSRKNNLSRYSVRDQIPIQIKHIVKIITSFNNSYSASVTFGATKERQREIFEPSVRNDILPEWNPSIGLYEGLKMTYDNYGN